MNRMLRKTAINALCAFCSAFVLCSLAAFPAGAVAQTYPTKPLRMVVTNAPGSGADVIARLIANKLSEALGQQIVIDNRSGASGRIGMELAARSAPDGYNLVMISSSNVVASAMFDKLKYDIVKDFSAISLLGETPFILVINPTLEANSVSELVALAKSKPGVLKYGQGSEAQHLSAEIFKHLAGSQILEVPYKGTSPAVTATLSGEVHMSFHAIPAVSTLIKSGKLRALGVTTGKRTPLVPGVPAISESVPGYEYTGWYAPFAPAKTPQSIITRLNAESIKAVNDPTMRERLAALGVDPLGTNPQECMTHLKKQVDKMSEAVRIAGIGVHE
jgi:tripartite-type tricarboxylate transporter receptor subunit TctC